MVLPFLYGALKVGRKAAKVAKGAAKIATSKKARCAARAATAKRGTKRQVFRSCMSGKRKSKR